MRVNVDSSAITEPRFRLLGRRLGVSWREALGSCLPVWFSCYERRKAILTVEEIDMAAEIDGFAEALVGVGLAHFEPHAPGSNVALAQESAAGSAQACFRKVTIHGVDDRISFLLKQRESGSKGGRKTSQNRGEESGKTRKNKGNSKSQASAAASAQASAAGSAQAYSPAPSLINNTPLSPNKSDEEEIPESLDTPRFRSAWSDWLAHRKEIKKPVTSTQAKAQLKKLAAEGEAAAIERIERAMANGWQGLFFGDEKPKQTPALPPPTTREVSDEELRELDRQARIKRDKAEAERLARQKAGPA